MARIDYRTTSQDVVYSDIFINLNVNPGNGQLARHTNEHAVKRSIKSLILTDEYERLYQPQIRSQIKKALFEPMGSIIAENIKSMIEETIRNHERRANIIEVIVVPMYEKNYYSVTIIFSMINIPEPVQMNITLNRIR